MQSAQKILQRYIENVNRKGSDAVRETGFHEQIQGGWVFYYNSAEYLDTGRFEAQLVGQGPVTILEDGTILEGGSAESPEDVLRRHTR